MNFLKPVFFVAALCAFTFSNAQSLTVSTIPFATGTTNPVDIVHAGDDRLFVVEQSGRIRIVRPDGSVDTTPFLNVDPLASSGGERGLLGLAFHPDYANNGYFYINFTDNSGDTQISRYTVSSDPDVADASSRFDIININQTQGNHNGGCLRFGPDGYLYIGMGDGGGAGDTPNNAQNINLLLGKMVRIDIDTTSPPLNYSIPADNPFIGQATRDEIWSIGLRNPWKFNFDTETGDMWIGDVGQGDLEEVDFEPAGSAGGLNYGWRCYEGTDVYNFAGCAGGSYVDPVSEYSHAGGACSITGGFVYRGENNLDMQGKYINVDYCSGRFRSVSPDGAGGFTTASVSANTGFGWSCFGWDVNQEMYVANQSSDIVYKVVDSDCVNYTVSFSTAGTTLTAGTGNSYQWYLDGTEIAGATTQVYEATTNGDYSVRVSNTDGCSARSEETTVVTEVGCTGDLTGDGVVNVSDFISFNSEFGEMCSGCDADFDGNGEVNVNDFLILNSNFGEICE